MKMSIQTGNSLDTVSSDKMTTPTPPPPATLPTVGVAPLSRRRSLLTEALELADQANTSDLPKAQALTATKEHADDPSETEEIQAPTAIPAAETPAAGVIDTKVVEEDEAKRVVVTDNISLGLGFLRSIAELRQQLQELENLKEFQAQLTEVTPESAQEGWLSKTFGTALRSVIHPKNSINDAASLAAYDKELSLWAEYFHYSYLLREIVKTDKDWQRALCVMGTKGGVSKTPLIVYLAAVFAFVTSTTNLLFEANENDGTVNDNLGTPRASQVLLNDVIADHSLIADHRTALKTLGKFDQTSLWVLLSAANIAENEFSMPEFLDTTQTIRPHFGNVWYDTGNGDRRASNEGAFLDSDIVFFPALAGNSYSWSRVITTMINLYQAGHAEKLQTRSCVVINATEEGDTIEYFLNIFLEVAAEAVKPRYSHKEGRLVAPLWTEDPVQLLRDLGFKYDTVTEKLTGEGMYLVEKSPWIASGKIVSVRPDDVGLGTIVDYLKILVAAFTTPTQDEEVKKNEIKRRIAERNETPISTPETMFASLVKAHNGDFENAVLQFAQYVEKQKKLVGANSAE
jgi:MinD-like ATPase involved in chromosome partitioning or flagellar assembly